MAYFNTPPSGLPSGIQSQLMGLGGRRLPPIGGPMPIPNPIHPGQPVIPPPPPAPVMHGGHPMSPLRAVFQDLQQGLNPVQLANIMAGRVPGHENGDFMALGRVHDNRGAIISQIAQMLSHGGQLPQNFNQFAHQINQGLAGGGGPTGIFHPHPPVPSPMPIIRRDILGNRPSKLNVGNTMLQHFMQRALGGR